LAVWPLDRSLLKASISNASGATPFETDHGRERIGDGSLLLQARTAYYADDTSSSRSPFDAPGASFTFKEHR
jgi:hypothetical protein